MKSKTDINRAAPGGLPAAIGKRALGIREAAA